MKTKALLPRSLAAGVVLAGLTLAPLSFADEAPIDNPPVISPADEGGIAETPAPVVGVVGDESGVDVGTPPEVVDAGTVVTADVPVVDDVIVPTRGGEMPPDSIEGANFRSNENLPTEGDVEALSYNMAPGGGVSENTAPLVPEASIEAANAALAATTADVVSAQEAATVEPVAAAGVVEASVDAKQIGAGTGPVIRDGHLIAR